MVYKISKWLEKLITLFMKLAIDTSDREKIVLKIDEGVYEETAKVGSSQKLLVFISDVFEKNGLRLEDIKEIEVNTGPGSFTGLRVGVSVAQALGWSLSVKVNGKNLEKGEVINLKYR